MPLFRNRDQQAAAPSIMKKVLFDSGQAGWERTDAPQADRGFNYRKTALLEGPVYARTFYENDYPDMRTIRGSVVSGIKSIMDTLGIPASDVRLGDARVGKKLGLRIEIAAPEFEAKIRPSLGIASAGDLGSNLVIGNFGGRQGGV